MMTPSSPNLCPECGKPVPADCQHRVCPACLMAQALASRTILPGGESGDALPPLSPEEIAGKFPQFEVNECLGRGGMGVVYKARQKSLDRWVAIKILPPERVGEMRFAERFAREAQTLARLSHPNIVTVFDYGETDGLFYIVMEYIDGVNLRDLLRDGKLEPQQALAIVPPICDALQYAHDKGIVHRDIKPENLLLDRDGRIKIADFGIAALIGAGAENIGTPPYMAPEQSGASSEVDSRADIYALGVVLYEMLTGERPNKELVAPSKKVQIDVRLDEIVLRALEKTPALRYQTAGEFRTVVETMAATNQSPTPNNSPAQTPPNRFPDILGAVLLIGLGMGLHALLDAPGWSMPLFGIPFLLYLRLRVPPGLFSSVVMTGWVIFISAFFFVIDQFVHREPKEFYFILTLFMLVGFWNHLRRRRESSQPAAAAASSVHILEFKTAMYLGHYAQAWEAAAPMFQRSNNKEEWVAQMEKIRRPLGKSVGGKMRSQHVTADHSRMDQAVEIHFDSLQTAVESMSIARHPDGEYRVVSYQIKPLDFAAGESETAPHQKNLPSRFSGTAIAGLCWAGLFFGLTASWLLDEGISMLVNPHFQKPIWAELISTILLGLGLTAIPGTTILGSVAVSQIRRSSGKLHGMWLAVFDGLLFPLLALDALLIGLPIFACKIDSQPMAGTGLEKALVILTITALAVAIGLDTLIIRRVWRAVNSNNPTTPQQTGSTEKPARSSRKAIFIAANVCMALSFAVLFTKWWNERKREGVWVPARISATITQQYGDAQVRVVDVSQTGQVVLVSFVCEMFRPDHELRVQYGGPVLSYPNDLASSVKTKVKDLDCLIVPRAKIVDDNIGEVLAGTNVLSGQTMFQIGFVLPDAQTAAQVVKAVQEVHLGKPRGMGEGGSVLLLFSLRRDSGKDAAGKPVVEGLDASLWSRPKSNAPAAHKSAAAPEPSFGPVIERVVNDAIDLDSGKTGTTPLDGLLKKGKDALLANIKGIEREGWDIIQDNPETIFGVGMKAVTLAAAQWDTLNPQQTVEQIKGAPVQAFVPFSPVTSFPATYAFQTREGSMGMLQITGFTESKGVKIRYKLVPIPPTTKGAPGKLAAFKPIPAEAARLLEEKENHTHIAPQTGGISVRGESPVSSSAANPVHINIAADGTLTVAGQPCPADQLADRLGKLANKDAVSVIVHADKKVPFQQVQTILDACKAAGIKESAIASGVTP